MKTLLFKKSYMTCKHDAGESIVRLADRQLRLFMAYCRRLSTIGKQYLLDLRTGDCWSAIPAGLADTRLSMAAWGESITRLWAKSSKQSVGQHNFWWMSIFDKSKASIQSKARPEKEWGVSHDTNRPPPFLNVYLGPPLLVLRWYLYPAYLAVTHGWVHDKFRSIII